MLLHFLKRDFLDHLLGWGLILLVTMIALAVSYVATWRLELAFLFLAYYFFASAAEWYVLGSVWRTQHLLSRHYLLALPISHKKLFLIQQARIVAFWLPFLTLAGISPFLLSAQEVFTAEAWLLYYLGLATSVATVIHTGIWTTVEMERVSSYLPKGERLWANIKLFVIMIAPVMILYIGWADLLSSTAASFWPGLRRLPLSKDPQLARVIFLGTFIALIFWIPRNARRWCVTL